jgi:predicted acetyltransferase
MDFQFNDYAPFTDGEIEVVVSQKKPADIEKGYVPSYEFAIRLKGSQEPVGRVGLRIGNTHHIITYAGHIGYKVHEEHRGHRYAVKACNLIRRVALDHGLRTLWITTNPDNWPSRRTCEILGSKFVETVDLPEDTDMYRRGERQTCSYRWDLMGRGVLQYAPTCER